MQLPSVRVAIALRFLRKKANCLPRPWPLLADDQDPNGLAARIARRPVGCSLAAFQVMIAQVGAYLAHHPKLVLGKIGLARIHELSLEELRRQAAHQQWKEELKELLPPLKARSTPRSPGGVDGWPIPPGEVEEGIRMHNCLCYDLLLECPPDGDPAIGTSAYRSKADAFKDIKLPASANGSPFFMAMAKGCLGRPGLLAFHSKKLSIGTRQRRWR